MRRANNLITVTTGKHYFPVVAGAVYITNVLYQWSCWYGTAPNDLVEVSGGSLYIGRNTDSFLQIPYASDEQIAARPNGTYYVYNGGQDLSAVTDPYLCRGSFREYGDTIKHGYWEGKRWLVIGDSISDIDQYAANGYPFYVASALGMEVSVRAISGRQISDTTKYEASFKKLYIPYQASDYDLVTLLMGTNDLAFGSTIAMVEEKLATAISEIRGRCPSAVIGYITNTDRGKDATGFDEYHDGGIVYHASNMNSVEAASALENYCRSNGINVLNISNTWRAEELPYRRLLSCSSSDTFSGYDATHPTDWTHSVIFAPMIANFIMGLAPSEPYGTYRFTRFDSGITTYRVLYAIGGCATNNKYREIPAAANKAVDRVRPPTHHFPPSYYCELTPPEGHQITSIKVTMGGRDITSEAVSGNEVYVRGWDGQINGDIVIYAAIDGGAFPDIEEPETPVEPPSGVLGKAYDRFGRLVDLPAGVRYLFRRDGTRVEIAAE